MRFELRYRMAHGVGSRVASFNDRYDAEADGIERYGEAFIEAIEYVKPKPGDLPPASSSHDMLMDKRPKRSDPKGGMVKHVRPPEVKHPDPR